MVTGIDTESAQNFISKFDLTEPHTIWKIGVLSSREFSYVSAKMLNAETSIDGLIETVRFGLLGFDNFKDKDGNDVKFATKTKDICAQTFNVISDNIVNIIPIDIMLDIGNKILEITKLTEKEIKN